MPAAKLAEEDIFNVARKIHSPQERADYLRQACGQDDVLRGRIEALLHVHEQEQSFLQQPALARPDVPAEQPGAVIGPYKLIEPIGEGGMGTVWKAEQTEPVKRAVALKLVKAGMDSKAVIARFETERQALAMMDHPNIAKVLDAGYTGVRNQESGVRGQEPGVGSPGRNQTGLTPDPCLLTPGLGRPYFVMELVKGVPITKFCDEHRLTLRERLELFIPVCHAVQHAHQKGIIHRDLKPSNVLVAALDPPLAKGGPGGVPKIIDFGVAKAAGQPLTEHSLVTGLGAIVGTLEYMAPEQAELNQLDIDTRSDIYSLGVLLYELLTGSPPFSRKELEKVGMVEMLRVIREDEPSQPSTRLSKLSSHHAPRDEPGLVSRSETATLATLAANRGAEPAKLTKLVKGELDWIVMKALEKDRNRRYETASALAMDLQRYLADEPVQAGPPSAAYRVRKFVRRHRLAFGLAGAAIVFVVVLVAGLTAGLVQIGHERDAVRIERDAVRAERDTVRTDRDQVRLQRDEIRKHLYAVDIKLAQQAFRIGDHAEMIRVLSRQRPEPEQADLRSFEWYYLWGLCHLERRVRHDHAGPVFDAVYSADGKTLATASADTTVKLRDPVTGEVVAELHGHSGDVNRIAFSEDGKLMVTASDDKTIRLWDRPAPGARATSAARLTLTGHRAWVVDAAFTPDGKTIISGDWAGEVIFWDVATGRPTTRFYPHQRIRALALTPDGAMLATGSDDDDWVVRLYDLISPRPVGDGPPLKRTLSGVGYVLALAFAPDGRTLAVGGKVGLVNLWEVDSGRRVAVLRGHQKSVRSVAFSPDGRYLVSSSSDGSARVWALENGRPYRTLVGHVEGECGTWCASFTPDSGGIVTAGHDGSIQFWDLHRATPWLDLEPPPGTAVRALAISPQGKTLAAGADDETLSFWDLVTKKLRARQTGHGGPVRIVAWSRDGSTVASHGFPGAIKLSDAETGAWRADLPHSSQLPVHGAVFAADSRTLYAGYSSFIRRWDLSTQQLLGDMRVRLPGYDYGWVALSPDGRTLATGRAGDETGLFNTATWQLRTSLKGPGPLATAFSPDGNILGAAIGNSVGLWDLKTGQLRLLYGHADSVLRVAFSPDGKTLASVSADATVRLWHVHTGQEMLLLDGVDLGPVCSVAFSPDGQLLVTGGHAPDGKRGQVRMWTAPQNQAIELRRDR